MLGILQQANEGRPKIAPRKYLRNETGLLRLHAFPRTQFLKLARNYLHGDSGHRACNQAGWCTIPGVLDVKKKIPDDVTCMPCDHHENEQIGEELVKIPDEMLGAEVVHGACTITVRADPDDKNAAAKLQALTDALSLVGQKTHLHLDALRLYLGSNVRCIAYMGEAADDRTYVLFLGDQMTAKTAVTLSEKASQIKGGFGSAERGVADQAYDKKRMSTLNPNRWWLGESKYQQRKVSAKMTTVVVHEIGHILHEREHSASFWTHKTTWGDEGRPPSTQASKVSQYATKSKLEYVAEVFTGLVMGIHYDQDVIDVYLELGGVTVETDPRTRRG